MKVKNSSKKIILVLGSIIILVTLLLFVEKIGRTDQNSDDFVFDISDNLQNQNNENGDISDVDSSITMKFTEVREIVTAKDKTNLRNKPSQGSDSKIMYVLSNGKIAMRTGISDSGWSRVEFEDEVYYAVSNFLTTDLDNVISTPIPMPEDEDVVQTEFKEVNHKVTAKEAVNLRTLPSVTHEDSVVVCQIKNGELATRTGINIDLGWSRVEYNGQTLYCVSRYLVTAE